MRFKFGRKFKETKSKHFIFCRKRKTNRRKKLVPLEEKRYNLAKKMRKKIKVFRHRKCQWPFGDPKQIDFHFCLKRIERTDSSYCPHHHDIAYRH